MFPLVPFPSTREVILFALVLSRIAGLFASLPVFGGSRVPLNIRVVVVVMITLTCFPILVITPPVIPTDIYALGLLALRELMIGVTL